MPSPVKPCITFSPSTHSFIPSSLFLTFSTRTPTSVFFFQSNGTSNSFLQHEGFAQSCPLSPVLACWNLWTSCILLVTLDSIHSESLLQLTQNCYRCPSVSITFK
jgi:hypothetical protein